MNRRQRRAAVKARGPGVPQVRKSAWVDSKLKESVAYHQAGRLAEAKRLYAEILSREPTTTMALHLLGALKYQEGEARQAVELIGKAVALQPDCADAHFNLGTALQELGRLDDAVASYRRALDLNPDLVSAHNNLGVMLKNLGRLDEALDSYHKALAIEPDFADAWNNLKLTMKALQFPKVPGDRRGDFYGDGLGHAARATGEFAMLQFYLDKFRPHEADESFRTAMAALPPKVAEEVTEKMGWIATPPISLNFRISWLPY